MEACVDHRVIIVPCYAIRNSNTEIASSIMMNRLEWQYPETRNLPLGMFQDQPAEV